jgi:hypothetical protein
VTLTITIVDSKLPSWNSVMRMHKHAQHQVQQEWLWRTIEALGADPTLYTVPVDICITSYQKGRLIDPDNLYAKGLIDGLKTRLFPDDNPAWVGSVKLCSRKSKHNSVTIQLTPVEDAK